MSKITIRTNNPQDDIKENGVASFWLYSHEKGWNVEWQCSCIWNMLDSKQLFDFFMEREVEVDEIDFKYYCEEME